MVAGGERVSHDLGKISQDILHTLVDFHLLDKTSPLFFVVDSRNERVHLNLCEETARGQNFSHDTPDLIRIKKVGGI